MGRRLRGIRHPPRCGAQHQRPEHRLGHVAVIPITGTSGPEETHIPLTADAGLTKYDQPYADVTSLQPVARVCLLRKRGLLHHAELERIARQLMTYLGL